MRINYNYKTNYSIRLRPTTAVKLYKMERVLQRLYRGSKVIGLSSILELLVANIPEQLIEKLEELAKVVYEQRYVAIKTRKNSYLLKK